MILNGHTLARFTPSLMKLASRSFASATSANEDRFCDTLLPLLWTFDDGHQDLIEIDARLRGEFGVRFRFFICPYLIDRYAARQLDDVRCQLRDPAARLLSWDQIGLLHEQGHAIGLHGHDHSDFNQMSEAQMIEQHEASITLLRTRLGLTTDSFAPPFGRMERNAALQLDVARKYFQRIYLSDNRIPPRRRGDVYNRRHSEFGNTVVPSVIKGLLQALSRRPGFPV
jgi:peptidoglycan/xylan/chitin deacetylase (PgdA/CDA1 family)